MLSRGITGLLAASIAVTACGSSAIGGGRPTSAPPSPAGSGSPPADSTPTSPFEVPGGSTPPGIATPPPSVSGAASPPGSHWSQQAAPQATPAPTMPPGDCPDPRYCGDYVLDAGEPRWPRDATGTATVHYRVNPRLPSFVAFSADDFARAVQTAATVWMHADPRLQLVYDGTTTDPPANGNGVVGFFPTGNGLANIQLTTSPGGDTITGFDVQLSEESDWIDAPCDGAHVPCTPYPGSGVDLGSILAHAWGHAIGIADFASARTRLLTDYGGVASGDDCSSGGPVCRYAATLGLGDVLAARHLYPTTAPMPTIYYDH